MAAGGFYLPPVVSELIGDIADFVEKMAEAKAILADFAADDGETQVHITADLSGLATTLAEGQQMIERIRDNPVGLLLPLKIGTPDWKKWNDDIVREVRTLTPAFEIPFTPQLDLAAVFAAEQEWEAMAVGHQLELPLKPYLSPADAFAAMQAARTVLGDSGIPIGVHVNGAEIAAQVAAISAAAHFKIPAEIQVDSAGFLAKVAGLAAAASLMLRGVGGGGRGGLLGTLGWGAGMGIPFLGLGGMAAFGSILGLAGFGMEHVLTTLIGLAGSLAGALLGMGVIAAGAFATMAVGMGADMAVMLEFNQAQKALKAGILTSADATLAQQALAALEQGTLTLAQATTLYGSASANAQYQTAQLGVTTDLMWLHAIGGALIQLSLLKDAVYSVAQVYIPMIAFAAGNNLSVIRTDLQPLFDWLKGPQGIGIFNDLESMFQQNLPTAMDAFVNAIEAVLKLLDYASHFTGGFITSIDNFFKKLNTPGGIDRFEGAMQTLVGLFHTWAAFFVELGKVIVDIFSQGVGLGAGIAQELTGMLTKLDTWLRSTSGKNAIGSLFQVHKQEIEAILRLLPALSPLASIYIALAVPLTNVVTQLANFLNFALHIPGAGPVIAYGLALGFLARQMALFTILGGAVDVVSGMAVALKSLGVAIAISSAAAEGSGFAGIMGFFKILATSGGPLAGLGSIGSGLGTAVEAIGGFFAGLGGIILAIVAAVVLLGAGLSALESKFSGLGRFSGVINAFLGPVGAMANVFNMVKQHWNDLVHAFEHPGAVFSNLGNTIHHLLDQIGGAVGGFFSRLGTLASKGWQAFASNPAYWIGYALGVVLAGMAGLVGAVASGLGTVDYNAVVWAGHMKDEAGRGSGDFINEVKTTLANLPGDFATWLANVVPQIPTWAGNLKTAAWNELFANKDSVVNKIKDAIAGLPGDFLKIGVAMVAGLISGINSQKDWAIAQIKSFLQGLIIGAQAHNKSSSPSMLWAEEVGRPIAQGIAVGITSGTGSVVTSLAALSRTMRAFPFQGPALAPAFAGAGGMGNVTISAPITVQVTGAMAGTPAGVGQAVERAVERQMQKVVQQLRSGTYMTPGHR